MSENKFKTMRHMETVRNYINAMVKYLLERGESHDQSKLETPEVEVFEEYTEKLRGCTYGSDEYKHNMEGMDVAIQHHYSMNRHHPEHFTLGSFGHEDFNDSPLEIMNLVDMLEMICDWKAATLRHDDGDILKSIEINQKRFGYGDEVKRILINTAHLLNDSGTVHSY